jgi:hypothetical protein
MLVWNPQLEHHLDTLDDKSTQSNEEARKSQDDGSVQEDKAIASHVPRNKERNQEIKDVSSRDWSPIVEWIGVGLLGYCLGGGSIVASIVLFLCTMAWLFWKQNISQLGTRILQQQEEPRFLKCRIELSKLLGSVGAPPLQRTVTSLENANATINYQLVLDFGTAHVRFLRQMDQSLNTLRTAVGMHLRTTLLSVDRVELASTVNRCRSSGRSNSILLPTARRMLSRVVLDQYRSLHDCCASLSTFDENDDIDDDSIEVPEVITLSWLKFMRHELADLLSFQMSQLMSSLEMLRDISHSDSALRRRCDASMSTAMESTEYLSSIFSLSPTIPESLDVLPHDLHTLYRQFDTASVALWACQQLYKKDSDDDDGGAVSNTTSVLEFLDQIESLLQSVGDVKEMLEQNLNGTTTKDGKVVDPNEEMGECRDKSTREPTDDPQDYEHSGQSFDAVSSRNDTGDIVNKKTIVFSASGSMQQQLISDNKGNGSTLTTIPPRQSVTTQHMVLQELQERLSKMDRSEEVGADGTRLDDSDTQRVVQKKKLSTSSMFLGASGDVLAELKNSIEKNGWPLSLNT